MEETQFIWKNGKLLPWEQATTHLLTHSLHYGSAAFEGLRVYKTDKGPAIFKLQEHVARLFFSAEQLGMQISYSQADVCQAIIDTARSNNFQEGYIRPLIYYGYGSMSSTPKEDTPIELMIACFPWDNTLSVKPINAIVSPYIRIHPKSTVVEAKISGHYVNSLMAGLKLRHTHYTGAVLLDVNGNVAEGCAANIFIEKDGALITPPQGTILMGITRATVMQIANQANIPVREEHFKPEDILKADEAFFCGTYVEISPVASLNDTLINNGKEGAITEKLKTQFQEIVHGQVPEYYDALSWVSTNKKEE